MEWKRTNFQPPRRAQGTQVPFSPAVTESITAKILQGGWNNIVSDHYILYNVLVYLYNEPPAQRLKSKHFTEMKVIILHLSFSKTLKELYKAFGDVKDLYRVHR